MSLQVFNISGNDLDSIKDLECLRCMTQLMANDNQLKDMKELAHIFGFWPNLWRLDLMGNPICHKAKYRDRVIVMAKSLGLFADVITMFNYIFICLCDIMNYILIHEILLKVSYKKV